MEQVNNGHECKYKAYRYTQLEMPYSSVSGVWPSLRDCSQPALWGRGGGVARAHVCGFGGRGRVGRIVVAAAVSSAHLWAC